MAANSKKKGVLIAIAVVLVAGIATGATILITRSISRARRLREIHVEIDLPMAPEVATLVTEALRSEAETLDEGSTVFVSTAPGDANQNPSEDAEGRETIVDGASDRGKPPSSREDIALDVRVAEVQAGVDNDASTYFAFDPYVFLVDQRLGGAILDTDLTVRSLADVLATLGSSDTVPLVVAGDERTEFAAFLLYLAGELLPENTFLEIVAALQRWSAATVESADTEALVAAFAPVVAVLQQWRERGILVFNWTDWDTIAVRQTIIDGRAAAVFRRRSELFSTDYSDVFFLRTQRLPVGVGRRSFRLWGQALAVAPGEGPRTDAAKHVAKLLRSGPIQESIEGETRYSPVLLEGSPMNRDHRNVVRWYENAEDFIVVTEEIAAHPVFERLHIQLR